MLLFSISFYQSFSKSTACFVALILLYQTESYIYARVERRKASLRQTVNAQKKHTRLKIWRVINQSQTEEFCDGRDVITC